MAANLIVKIFFFVILALIDGIKNYGHLGCFAPIEAWFIGNYCIILYFVFSFFFLIFAVCCSADFVFRLLLWSWAISIVSFFVWTILGTFFVIINVLAGNHCLSEFDYVWMALWFGVFYGVIVVLIIESFREKWKKNELESQLLSIYSDKTWLLKENPQQFMEKYQTLLESLQLLDIEQDLIKKHFTIEVSADDPDNGECSICLGEFGIADEKTKIGCMHSFHYGCLMNWFKVKPNCPLCKTNFRKALLLELFEERSADNNA